MKKIFLSFLFFLLTQPLLWAQKLPERSKVLVNDYAHALSPQEISALEHKLSSFNDSTTVQIAIVIISTLDGYPIEDYSFKLATKWGIGQKDKKNGALILVALNDHKVRIETGYGLEGVAPDVLEKRIIENDIKPNFKESQYYEGLDAATNSLMQLAKGEYKATSPPRRNQQKFPSFMIFVFLGIIAVVIFSKYRSVRTYASNNNIGFWVAWGLLNASLGSRGGFWNDFSGGSGGFGGGGSDDGGGFGGFGGGSFGGGGASGDW